MSKRLYDGLFGQEPTLTERMQDQFYDAVNRIRPCFYRRSKRNVRVAEELIKKGQSGYFRHHKKHIGEMVKALEETNDAGLLGVLNLLGCFRVERASRILKEYNRQLKPFKGRQYATK